MSDFNRKLSASEVDDDTDEESAEILDEAMSDFVSSITELLQNIDEHTDVVREIEALVKKMDCSLKSVTKNAEKNFNTDREARSDYRERFLDFLKCLRRLCKILGIKSSKLPRDLLNSKSTPMDVRHFHSRLLAIVMKIFSKCISKLSSSLKDLRTAANNSRFHLDNINGEFDELDISKDAGEEDGEEEDGEEGEDDDEDD